MHSTKVNKYILCITMLILCCPMLHASIMDQTISIFSDQDLVMNEEYSADNNENNSYQVISPAVYTTIITETIQLPSADIIHNLDYSQLDIFVDNAAPDHQQAPYPYQHKFVAKIVEPADPD